MAEHAGSCQEQTQRQTDRRVYKDRQTDAYLKTETDAYLKTETDAYIKTDRQTRV